MSYQKFFSGKKITVMGLGILGRGVGDVEFLAQFNTQLTVTDLKKPAELETSLERLKPYKSIKFTLGEHRLEDFRDCDFVIKAAGVPLQNPYIAEAEKNGVPVYMSTALFAKFAKAFLIGVTGTRGKSTTTQMIYEGLLADGRRVHLGGNIRGKSTLAMLPEVQPGDAVVLELDSWQLQGFRSLKISPQIAVFTNLMPDHMNYYKDDMDLYFHDKAAIFESQLEEDFLISGDDIADKIKAVKPRSKIIKAESLPGSWQLMVPGEHNRLNAAYARETLQLMNINEATIRKALESFKGLEGRLHLVATVKGVGIYNDSNATTPAATIAALKSFEKGKILLLAGGADKNLDIAELVREIPARCREVALLEGTGTKRLLPSLPNSPVFDSIEKAFHHLTARAKPGDVLVLSPAFASFGMFKNEYDRGDQFDALAHSYSNKNT